MRALGAPSPRDLHRLKPLLPEPCRWPGGCNECMRGALTSVMLCGTLLGGDRYQTVAHTGVSPKPGPVSKLKRVSVRQQDAAPHNAPASSLATCKLVTRAKSPPVERSGPLSYWRVYIVTDLFVWLTTTINAILLTIALCLGLYVVTRTLRGWVTWLAGLMLWSLAGFYLYNALAATTPAQSPALA
jgi:hypothetical protein